MEDDSGRPAKRFKHQSYQATLKSVHLPSASVQSRLDDDIPDSESHFHNALDHWRQLNLSPAFLRFASKVQGFSANVPLLLHHAPEIVVLWIEAAEKADDDSWRALLDLLQKLVHDLRGTLLPSYLPLLEVLLAPLPRSLSAETLTVLMATLSSFFKHLLNASPELLVQTWTSLVSTLPQCNSEVQRAVAEVWATVLRRCKGELRETAVNLIMRDVEMIADASAWMFVCAFKSVTHTLHTCTSPLFDTFLSAHLSPQNRTRTETVLRRVITALIHHCDKAEQFAPVSDLLVSRFTSATAQDEVPVVMNLMSVACSVRRGSRITQKQLASILVHMAQKPALSVARGHLLTLGTAALLAGEMPVWMGPGRRFIEMSWEDPPLGLELSGALSDLEWGGWRLIELPFTLKYTMQLFHDHSRLTLNLLAALVKMGRLDDADEGWMQRVAASMQARLEAWTMSEDNIQELASILALSSLLPSLAPGLVRIATRSLEHEDTGERYGGTDALAGKVFGACLTALADMPSRDWAQHADVSVWTVRAVKRWGSCETVLGGLVAISRQRSSTGAPIPLVEIYPSLQASILSHSRYLRLNALQLLTSSLIERTQSDEVLKRCLHGEEASLDVQGARERVIKITGAPQVLKAGDDVGADVCGRWLIAQLKVNLRPLWVPSAKALALLSERFAPLVWKLVFTELEGAVNHDIGGVSESQMDTDVSDEAIEAERSWRDPSAAKLRVAIGKWSHVDAGQLLVPETLRQRLDIGNYEAQLLNTLGEVSVLTQRHNADLVRLFLSFASPDLPSKPPRTKLSNWLTLFSKLDNPKSFHQTSTLQSLYRSLLSHPDRALQSVALTCLLNYKSPHLVPYEGNLRAFLDNTKWRDELTSFDIARIEEGDRSEAVDVIVRLFFGLMLERHGRTKGADRRASLLGALGGCREEELRLLVDLMLEPFSMSSSSSAAVDNLLVDSSEKQQTGFMNLLGDVMKRMGSRLVPYWPALLLATINLVTQAQKKLDAIPDSTEHPDEEDAEDAERAAIDQDSISPAYSKARPTRTVRQLGIKRFTDFFRNDVAFDFGPYIPTAFAAFISPRLAALDRENSQFPSAILELFYAWSARRDFIPFLVDYDNRVLPKIYACLQAVNVKPVVVSRIYDITEHLLTLSEDNGEVAELVLRPHISSLLDALSAPLPNTSGSRSDLLHRQVGVLSQVAPFASDASQARRVLQHFMPLLKRPSKVIPEKTKVHLLKITRGIIPVVPEFQEPTSVTYVQTYELFAKLFQTLRSKPARIALLDAFDQLSLVDPSLRRINDLLASLNAFSDKRLDEPDFNRRLQAFTELNEALYSQLSSCEWQPILFNMLQFIQDPEELAVRTNAAFSLKRFVDVLSLQGHPEMEVLFTRIFLPGLKNCLLSKVELVRNEVLGVIAYGVLKCDSIPSLNELRPLLAKGDAEADFFNNIHHIQIHRRTRALRRLVEYVESGSVRSTNLSEIFVPLIGHFIVNAPTTDHILVDVAIASTGAMARRLNWGAYNGLVRQYMKLIKKKTPAERACVRALVAVLENFHFPMDDIVADDEPLADVQEEPVQDGADETLGAAEEKLEEPKKYTPAASTKKIADAVNTHLLPNLLHHLEKREENEDALRIPVAIGVIQVARHLPKAPMEAQISRLLTVLCQVLRSKSQDTRALTRETLCKIAVIVGPAYLAQIMTELRAALLQGPHLHVLATVTHALLVHVTSPDIVPAFNDLDACAADVAHVSAEVIFGQSSRDVQSEGFKTTILEVRGSSTKGLDSFAILAKHITPPRISAVLNPIRGIMHETEAAKTLQMVDDVLRRISGGLNANTHLTPPELLVLCHTLIQQNAKFLKEAPRPMHGKGKAKGHFAVQTKRRLNQDADHYAQNSFRFVAFGLDLFNTAFRRGRFDFNDPQIIARLEPMVSVVGNTLYSQDVLVVIQGLKASASMIKCPLKSIEKSLPVFVRQTLDIVKQAGNTESEVVQTAFRTLAVIIRDCAASQVKEKDLEYLLEVLTPDLEEPNRQAAVFGLLRAIVSRKFIVTEIYDIMDKVAEIMVTNQSIQVQELCRAVLLQFLLDYPQGKGRLRNQMTFLAQNLSYVYESGRRSVMELLNAIFAKFETGLLREHADLFFVALVMVMANDDSAKCREMAAELIKLLFTHLDVDHRRVVVSHLHSWSSQKARLQLSRVSAQVYGLVVDTLQQDVTPYLPGLLEDINQVMRRSAMELQELESHSNDTSGMDVDLEWQLPYHALNVITKVLRVHHELIQEGDKIDWPAISSHLLFPHAWVRNASSRLVGLLFNVTPPGAHTPGLADDSLVSLSGLIEVARRSCLQLKSDTLDSLSSLQVVKNLFYIGKCFCMISKSSATEGPVGNSGESQIDDNQEAGGDHESEDKLENIRSNPLPWLFSKLSYQVRSAWIARRNRSTGHDTWSEQPLAIFRWFAAMASHMEPAALETFLVHILSPVYRILDDDTVSDAQIGDLKTLAQELLELVQNKIGTTKFADVYNRIRQSIVAVRRERKNERVIQTTTNPKASAHRKILRNLAKKDNRTRKDRVFAEGKIRAITEPKLRDV